MGCLSIVASSFCSSIDIIGFCTTASMQIQLNHRPSASKQHNSNRIMGKIGIEPIMFTARERIYSPPQHRQSLPLSHNPDSRVSKVIYRVMRSTRLFSSVPVPRSCFGGLFLKCLLKTPCRQRALIGDIFNSETEPNGKLFFHSGYAVTYLLKNNPHTHIRQFFLSIKRMDSFGRNGSSGARTQDRPVMSRLL